MQNSLKNIFLCVCGGSFGLLSSAGVFTVLVAVGLIPRFAGKTRTASKVVFYEEMVIAGTVFGGIVSVFGRYLHFGDLLIKAGISAHAVEVFGIAATVLFGLFAGIFVGCLALAIAEMLNSIPIFARRIGFRHGLGIVVLFMALGKLIGSLLYYALEIS